MGGGEKGDALCTNLCREEKQILETGHCCCLGKPDKTEQKENSKCKSFCFKRSKEIFFLNIEVSHNYLSNLLMQTLMIVVFITCVYYIQLFC